MDSGLQGRRQAAVARSRASSPRADCGGPTATGRSEKAPQRWYRSVRSEEAGKEGSSRIGEYFPFDCRRVRVEAHAGGAVPSDTDQARMVIVACLSKDGKDRKSTRLNSSHYCATRMPSDS